MIVPMMISVVGGDHAPPEAVRMAEEVGRELARRGCTLVCGGRGGVMEAACRGARAEGGHTIGILPTADSGGMNPYVEYPIVTGLGIARNSIVVLSGSAVIAVDGSYGTLSEIAYALQYGKPVVLLASWSLSAPGPEQPPLIRADSPGEAVEKALAAADKASSPLASEGPAHGD
jgi:uncharacterized protein (TIGR00725 family)